MTPQPNLIPAYARRAVAPTRTYDFGYGDQTHGFAVAISNGRAVEKISRRNIFFQRHKS